MTAILVGGVSALLALVVLRPALTGRRIPHPTAQRTGDLVSAPTRTDAARPVLRQLRDLDDDLATGKVAADDYPALRRALETQAADRLSSLAAPDATTGAPSRPGPKPGRAPSRPDPRPGRATSARRTRWTRRAVGVLAVAAAVTAAVAAVVGLLLGAVGQPRPESPTGPGQTAAAAQAASVRAAVARVTAHPRRVSAHLDLARVYAAANQPQLAVVEYLAATKLDPDNPEANTALALVAFTARSHRQAETLASRALAARPDYPEALYARGMIRAMGLHHPAAARRDLRAYLDAAPFGAHRTTVETVLALVDGARR